MKKLIMAIIVVCSVFYFVQPPSVTRDDSPRIQTSIDETVAEKEAGMTYIERGQRMLHFKESVEAALAERVSPSEYVPAADIPDVMKEAIVAVEDRRFYDHPGFDIYGVFRALYVNSLAGDTVEGGSTITQQLVKTLFLSSDRVWSRKAEEFVLSLMMEYNYSKEDILAMYLNSIYYGNSYYGLKEASEGYFHESPESLNLPEAALLAGLPQAPSFYNPKENPIAANAKREIVLEAMLSQHMITLKQMDAAKVAPLLK